MLIKDKVCVVTGAASGIGEAVARAYAEAGARGVVVADLKSSRERLAKVAGDIDGFAVTADVGEEPDIKALIAAAEDKYGPIDIFFSNAGLSRKGQETASDADWDVSWRVHVMSHVFAARALLPGMLARGSGYLLNTASAAGLLASLNSMPYGVTKNAAVALAEHLAIQYGDRGIRVSVLCPQSVQTGMTMAGRAGRRRDAAAGGGAPGDRGDGRGTLYDPVAPAGARIRPAQGFQPRPLDRRHAAAARQGVWNAGGGLIRRADADRGSFNRVCRSRLRTCRGFRS
jgi:NAD(P)-dependent dehydrogenase (short-subunit alcohol dehydrogenase family)